MSCRGALEGAGGHLNLEKVGAALALAVVAASLLGLSVGEHTDDRAMLLDVLKVGLDLALVEVGSVAPEGGLLGGVPVLVEAALDLLAEMLGPDSLVGAQAAVGLDVARKADDDCERREKRINVGVARERGAMESGTRRTARKSKLESRVAAIRQIFKADGIFVIRQRPRASNATPATRSRPWAGGCARHSERPQAASHSWGASRRWSRAR